MYDTHTTLLKLPGTGSTDFTDSSNTCGSSVAGVIYKTRILQSIWSR